MVKGNEFIIEFLYLEQLMQSLEVALPNAKKKQKKTCHTVLWLQLILFEYLHNIKINLTV